MHMYTNTHTHAKQKQPAHLPSLCVLHSSFSLLLIPHKCKHVAPSPPITSALHTFLLPSFPTSFHPRRHLQTDGGSRHAAQTCLPVCFDIVASGFAWSPRSGTNNLFNPLIIIRGINKFRMGDCTLNSEPLPFAEIYLFAIFSDCCLATKGASWCASLEVHMWNKSIKWMRWMLLYICNIQIYSSI